MPTPNSENTGKGRDFQQEAIRILGPYYGVSFRSEYAVPIGNPPKAHKFDLVSADLQYVGESKNYSWTEGNNVPSAKMAFVNEAIFYLQHLPKDKHRFVVMRRDTRSSNGESLAEYYYRTNKHLLDGVLIVEIDVHTDEVREFR